MNKSLQAEIEKNTTFLLFVKTVCANACLWLLLLLALVLTGCGSGSNDPDIEIPPYPIFSLWAENDGCRNLHFEQQPGKPAAQFGEPYNLDVYFSRHLKHLAQCNIDYTITGTDKAGAYTITNAVFVAGSHATDPGCNSLNTTGHYYLKSKLVPRIMYMQPATGEAIEYHYCKPTLFDEDGVQIQGCVPKVCGIL